METLPDDCLVLGQRLYCAVDIPMAKAGQYLVVVHGVIVGIDPDGTTKPRTPRADECLIPGKRIRIVVNLPPIEAGSSLIIVHGVCVDVDTRAAAERHRGTTAPHVGAAQRYAGDETERFPARRRRLAGYDKLVDRITDSNILDLIAAADEPILSITIGDRLGLPRSDTSLRSRVSHRLSKLMSDGDIFAQGPATRRTYTIAPRPDADTAPQAAPAEAAPAEAEPSEPVLHESV